MKRCTSCGAYFDGKRWHDPERVKPPEGRSLGEALCPPCRMQSEGSYGGVLHMAGPVLLEGRDEVLRILRSEEAHERRCNHLSRIVRIQDDGDRWKVLTASPQLAVHLGKRLKKSFGGKLRLYPDGAGRRDRKEETNGTIAVNWELPAADA